jgi:hypothetical protein
MFELTKCCRFYKNLVDLILQNFSLLSKNIDGLVVRVSGYRFSGPGFDSRPYQFFWDVGSLERGPLSLVRTIEKLLEWKKVAAPF